MRLKLPLHGRDHRAGGSDPIKGFLHWGSNTDDDSEGLVLNAEGNVAINTDDHNFTVNTEGGSSGGKITLKAGTDGIDIGCETATFLRALASDLGIQSWHMHADSAIEIEALGAASVLGLTGVTLDATGAGGSGASVTLKADTGISLQPGTGQTTSAGSKRITSVADPTSAQDAATKAYVDSATGATIPLTTKGDLYTYSTAGTRLGVGSNGQVLLADSTQTTGLKWGDIDGGSP